MHKYLGYYCKTISTSARPNMVSLTTCRAFWSSSWISARSKIISCSSNANVRLMHSTTTFSITWRRGSCASWTSRTRRTKRWCSWEEALEVPSTACRIIRRKTLFCSAPGLQWLDLLLFLMPCPQFWNIFIWRCFYASPFSYLFCWSLLFKMSQSCWVKSTKVVFLQKW